MKRTASIIVAWDLIPQESRSVFSYPPHVGAKALVSFSNLKRFEVQEVRRIGRFKFETQITEGKALGEIASLLELSGAVSPNLDALGRNVETTLEVAKQPFR